MVTTTARAQRLPLQPPTAVAVLRNVSKAEVEPATLARLVEVDPALSAMVLRMANSPLFGFSGRVASARQATVLLGTKTVGALAVGGTASLVFGAEEQVTTTPGAWSHAVTVGCSSSAAARFLGVNPEEAFTAGLLHNCSTLYTFPDADHGVTATGVVATRHCAAEESAELLRAWGLPSALVRAVRLHDRSRDGVTDGLALAVLLGHALAPVVEGSDPVGPTSPNDAFDSLGVGSGRFEEVVGGIRREVESIATFLEKEAA